LLSQLLNKNVDIKVIAHDYKTKKKNYLTVGTIPKSIIKTVERGEIDFPNTNT
jgi:hypothetical protein